MGRQNELPAALRKNTPSAKYRLGSALNLRQAIVASAVQYRSVRQRRHYADQGMDCGIIKTDTLM